MKPAPKFLDKLDRYWQPINKNQKVMKFKYCKKCFTMTGRSENEFGIIFAPLRID